MQRLDYTKLQPLSQNTEYNKNKRACDSRECVDAITTFLDNYKNYLLNTNVYECASLLISENNWFNKKEFVAYMYHGAKVELKVGQLVQVDLGKTYKVECGLIHYALILKTFEKKLLVVPMTTNSDIFDIAYHPTVNARGNFEYRRGLVSEGFTHDVALFMNAIRCVSIGRVIPKEYVSAVTPETVLDIQLHIEKLGLLQLYKSRLNRENELVQQNQDISLQNEKLLDILGEIKGKIEYVEEEIFTNTIDII